MTQKQEWNRRKERIMPKNQFEPGKSGNPNGRPKKGEAIRDVIEEVGNKLIDPKKDKRTFWEALSLRLFKTAVAAKDDGASTTAAKYLIDRRYGKPKEHVDANVSGDVNIIINKIVEEDDDGEE